MAMPRFRSEIAAMSPYKVGRQMADVAREHGLDPSEIVKLTANEGPDGPFPGVVDAVTAVLDASNRYPDNDCWDLGHRLAEELGVEFSNLLFGAGSVALLVEIGLAMGGPGTNIVYGWPSFIMYRFTALWAGSESREVRLGGDHSLDLDAMRMAIDDGTRVVIVCNPNNPTGTIKSAEEIEAFIDDVPEDVLVVMDEAYHEFVTDSRYRTEIPLAIERPNVVVLRTFSKIYALAAHRVGYAVARGGPDHRAPQGSSAIDRQQSCPSGGDGDPGPTRGTGPAACHERGEETSRRRRVVRTWSRRRRVAHQFRLFPPR